MTKHPTKVPAILQTSGPIPKQVKEVLVGRMVELGGKSKPKALKPKNPPKKGGRRGY